MMNILLWKKVYDQSGATPPEGWPRKIKHDGHTISVSDIWFIGHYLNKIGTITGDITGMYEKGIIVGNQQRIEADIVVNCVGFHRNATIVKDLCDHKEMYNNNYLDKNFIYLRRNLIHNHIFNVRADTLEMFF